MLSLRPSPISRTHPKRNDQARANSSTSNGGGPRVAQNATQPQGIPSVRTIARLHARRSRSAGPERRFSLFPRCIFSGIGRFLEYPLRLLKAQPLSISERAVSTRQQQAALLPSLLGEPCDGCFPDIALALSPYGLTICATQSEKGGTTVDN